MRAYLRRVLAAHRQVKTVEKRIDAYDAVCQLIGRDVDPAIRQALNTEHAAAALAYVRAVVGDPKPETTRLEDAS